MRIFLEMYVYKSFQIVNPEFLIGAGQPKIFTGLQPRLIFSISMYHREWNQVPVWIFNPAQSLSIY